jgi:hypothetical protein
MVIGEQGLAALAFGKIEEVYEIEGGLLDTWVGFLAPFLGSVFQSIFPLFLDFARSVSCLFYCTFRPSRWIWGRFLDLFWTVHFISDAT